MHMPELNNNKNKAPSSSREDDLGTMQSNESSLTDLRGRLYRGPARAEGLPVIPFRDGDHNPLQFAPYTQTSHTRSYTTSEKEIQGREMM